MCSQSRWLRAIPIRNDSPWEWRWLDELLVLTYLAQLRRHLFRRLELAVSDSHALRWFDMFPLEAILGLAERYPVAPSGNYFWQLGLREALRPGSIVQCGWPSASPNGSFS